MRLDYVMCTASWECGITAKLFPAISVSIVTLSSLIGESSWVVWFFTSNWAGDLFIYLIVF